MGERTLSGRTFALPDAPDANLSVVTGVVPLTQEGIAVGTGWGVGEFYDLWVTGSILRVEFCQITPGSGGDGMFWDNMEFGAVPEPGSILALGLGVAAFARRRSAKK